MRPASGGGHGPTRHFWFLSGTEGLGATTSVVDLVSWANRLLHEDQVEFEKPGATFGAVHVIMLGRAREVMGRKLLAEMLMTGKTIDAATAREYGIVNHVVPQDQVLDEALRTANQIAACPALTIEVIRRMMHRGNDDDYRWEDLLSPGLLLMEDLKEGQRAFIERRKPEFRGK